MSKIDTMDNETMVEALKYLNYCQLAKNSLISKRFRNVIQTHRHKLALLYVNHIAMDSCQSFPLHVQIFGNELSPDAYNEWIIHNDYLKQIPIESQAASEESTQSITKKYGFAASACYKDPSHRGYDDLTRVVSARVELNNENWPLFQHFVRLIADPFIYIREMRLIYQNDVLKALARAINQNRNRLQCERLEFDFEGNSQKSITWIKNNARCNNLSIRSDGDLNQDEAFFDFLLTGANYTQSIEVLYDHLLKVVTDFVQKFMDLKDSGESQLVETIEGEISVPDKELFKRDYAKFIVKEERHEDADCTEQVFEFVNTDVGKKLQLTSYILGCAYNYDVGYVFEALTELRALEIDTLEGKNHSPLVSISNAKCKLSLSPCSCRSRSSASSMSELSCASVFCSGSSCKWLRPDDVNLVLARIFGKSIRSIDLTFRWTDHYDICPKIVEVVDEIDKSDREQSKFPEEARPIVNMLYKHGYVGNYEYKWLRFKEYFDRHRNAITEKWQYGYLRAGKPDWL